MKNISNNFLGNLLTIVLLALTFSACTKEEVFEFPSNEYDPNAPKIEVVSVEGTGYKGDTLEIKANISDLSGMRFVKAQYDAWEMVVAEIFEDAPKELAEYTFKVPVPFGSGFGEHEIIIAAQNVNNKDISTLAVVEIKARPGSLLSMYVQGDMILAGSLDYGWDAKYADKMYWNNSGQLELLVYNHKANAEFRFISERKEGDDQHIYGLAAEADDAVTKGAEGKIKIKETGYHKILLDPERLNYDVVKVELDHAFVNELYFVGSGFENMSDWTPSEALPLTRDEVNPNEYTIVVQRSQAEEGFSKFLPFNTGWAGIISWVENLEVSDPAENDFYMTNIDLGAGMTGCHYSGDAGERYRAKIDLVLNKAVVVPYVLDPSITAPTVSVTSAPSEPLGRGEAFTIGADISDEQSLTAVSVAVADWNMKVDIESPSNPYNLMETLTVPFDAQIKDVDCVITAINNNGLVTEQTVTISLKSNALFSDMFVLGDVSLSALGGKGNDYRFADKMEILADGFELRVYNPVANGAFHFVTARSEGDAQIFGGQDGFLAENGNAIIIPEVGYYKIVCSNDANTYTIERETVTLTPDFKSNNMKVIGSGTGVDNGWDYPTVPRIPQLVDNPWAFVGALPLDAGAQWLKFCDSADDNSDWQQVKEFAWVGDTYQFDTPGNENFKIQSSDGHSGAQTTVALDGQLVIDMYLGRAVYVY